MSLAIGKIMQAKGYINRFTKAMPFRFKCKDPMKTQWEFLRNLLQSHAQTEFGRKYGFHQIKSIQAYQQMVPVHKWADLLPFIEEVKKGNTNALIPPTDPLLMFATTSGTTGDWKYIPVTKSSYKFYNNSWDLTWSNVLREAPRGFYGKALYFPGDPAEGFVGSVPYGAITGKAYAAQNKIIQKVYPYPYQICRIKDYDLRYYTLMRIAVEQNISCIAIANPSTSLTLFRVAQERREEIIHDIKTGTLRDSEKMPEEFVRLVLPALRPNPKRAEELEAIYQRTGDFLPKDYWGKFLSYFIAFTSGPVSLYLPHLRKYLGDIPFFDFGLLASEGRFSFPISSTQGGCLTLESNFFEFIPENEAALPNPRVLTLDQVRLGERYFILLTNASGLYRYNIVDLIQVTGFYEKVPLIQFCNKGSHMSSITGEKLSEFQVTESVRRAMEKSGSSLDRFLVCLHWDHDLPHYSLLVSESESHKLKHQDFINSAEEELMRINNEYLSKRQSKRIGPLTLKVVEGSALEEYQEKKKKECHNLCQYKEVFLISDPAFEQQFHFKIQLQAQEFKDKTQSVIF